jgi:hypothetical protein
MAKRGRKPNPNKRVGYFWEPEEAAAIAYNEALTQEDKDKIFIELKIPLTKMIESIIKRYKLNIPNEAFENTFNDTMSFLLTKVNNFKPEKNKKAYSYYQTIVKNYLIFQNEKYTKNRNRTISYEDISSDIENNEDFSYVNSYENNIAFFNELIKNTIVGINNILNGNTHKLSKNEIKIGHALINLLENWDELFLKTGSNKFNKNSILFFIKETTLLSTKEIRDGMKKYKTVYFKTKNKLLDI